MIFIKQFLIVALFVAYHTKDPIYEAFCEALWRSLIMLGRSRGAESVENGKDQVSNIGFAL